ncbi:MAG: hypothetical protein KDB27_13825 [Planctomycetales bacterium]|nr:hypothetical protein [Planctomycetales bacterium]
MSSKRQLKSEPLPQNVTVSKLLSKCCGFVSSFTFAFAIATAALSIAPSQIALAQDNGEDVFPELEDDDFSLLSPDNEVGDDEEPGVADDGNADDGDNGTEEDSTDESSDGGLPPSIIIDNQRSVEPLIEEELPQGQPVPENVPSITDTIADPPSAELIVERYPSGKPKIEREVTQDKNENYINHGSWVMKDEAGRTTIRGQYRFGKRHGEWVRIYDAAEAELFSAAPYNQYQVGQFRSIGNFVDGNLNGKWIIQDDSQVPRTISEWNFVDGRRDGESVWFYSTGTKMRVINYHNGELHGKLVEYDSDENVVTDVEYMNGRRLEKTTKYFADDSKQVQVEGWVLRARLSLKTPDDWWAVKLATYTREGKDEKHGRWTAYYANGEKRMEGEYHYDQPSGEFVWHYENGQKSLEATYAVGKKEGVWTWWHENGIRSIRGAYINGSPANRWTWWNKDGKVSHRIDYTITGDNVANPASTPDSTAQ